jgi:hypothetical protein
MDRREAMFERAQRLNLSVPVLIVLNQVRLHVPMRRHRMAEWIARDSEILGRPWGVADFENAISECIDRGWLAVLTAEDVEQPAPPHSTYPTYNTGQKGQLDWTPQGYELARMLFGEDLVQPGF